jgi:cytoskeletal protein CcmA (bactofilin family)
MKATTVLFLIAMVLISVGLCPAAGFESGKVVVSMPIGDDLYLAGGKVVVSEPASGDLVAAGGSLIINGPVGADLQIAGGSLLVNAPVADDLRAAGGDLVLSSTVGGDLVVFGGDVTIPAGAVIEGDAVIGAGNLHLGGTVRGDLLVQAGTMDITGTVMGSVKLYATDRININGSIQGDIVFAGPTVNLGPAARFDKDVSYWREDGEMNFGQVPVGGQTRFDPELKGKVDRYSAISAERHVDRGTKGFFFGTMLSGILVIVLSVLLCKGIFRLAGEALHRSYWQSTGIGILTLILLPVAGLLISVTIIGIPVGLFLMAVFAFSIIFGLVITSMGFTAWLERRRVNEWSTGRFMLVSVGLYVAIKLVSVIPFVGWLAVLFAVFAGYGALVPGISRTRSAI